MFERFRKSGGRFREIVDFDPRVGLLGGAGVGYDFGTGFAVLAEVILARKGAYSDIVLDNTPIRIRFDLTYIEVPLLAQYRFDTGGYVHPKFFAGPMFALKQNSRVKLRALGSDLTQDEEDDSIEGTDFGAVVGAGVEVEVGDQRLSFEARASFGMADITRPDPDRGNPSLRNRGIEILVGFVF